MTPLDIVVSRTLFGDWQISTLAEFFSVKKTDGEIEHIMTFPCTTFADAGEAIALVRDMLIPEQPTKQIIVL